MASSQDFVDYITGQCSDAGRITTRKMFGEYVLYCNGKVCADICDNTLFVKITKEGYSVFEKYGIDVQKAPPYAGAKDLFLIEDTDNIPFITELIAQTYAALPDSKQKKSYL